MRLMLMAERNSFRADSRSEERRHPPSIRRVGIDGHTSTSRRSRGREPPAFKHSAAAAMATARPATCPPGRTTAAQILNKLQYAPERSLASSVDAGRPVREPRPQQIGAYTVMLAASAGIVYRQENELSQQPVQQNHAGTGTRAQIRSRAPFKSIQHSSMF